MDEMKGINAKRAASQLVDLTPKEQVSELNGCARAALALTI